MSEMPFIDYLNMGDDLLEARYGITSRDVDIASVATCQDDLWSAVEGVEWLAGKWELVWVSGRIVRFSRGGEMRRPLTVGNASSNLWDGDKCPYGACLKRVAAVGCHQ